jgi:putative heme-binding domain-containing protein
MSRSIGLPAALLLALVLTSAAPAFAQRELKEIPDPNPELEQKTFVLPEGFEVNLYAHDPQIAKPIQMNFDADGRLWIASSSTYPQVEPGKPANDRILVLEDQDGDGVSDKTTVFADGLLIPSGVIAGDGGAYVGASTDLFFFKDTDGDGKADEKRFVLSGFGTEDTHHTLHTLRWGPEQLLYFKQSIYIHSHLETPWGVKRLNAGGTWQFRPENLKLEVFDRGLVNSWGIAWDDYGSTFATDGAGGEGINYIVPGASYMTAYGADRILSGLNPGSPKHCSLEIVGGPSMPEDWQESLITNDFRGHRVCRFVVREVGSGYISQEQQEVIKSDHPAFRPIDVKQGPDGAIYIADWYNPIIQHGEVDFRDPRRDHTHGRIWRVTWKGSKATGKPIATNPLSKRPTSELVSLLATGDRFGRQHAKRILKERGAEKVLPELDAWVATLDANDPDFERSRLEALWMHQAFDAPDWKLLSALVQSKNERTRSGAVRVIGHWLDRGHTDFENLKVVADKPNTAALLALAVADPNARVRLEAVRVLGKATDPRAAELAMTALDSPMDEYLDYALWLTARELQPIWQPALTAGKIDFGGKARHIAFACKAAGSQAAVPSLLALLTAGKVEAADLSGVLDVVGGFGSPADLQALLERAVAVQSDTNSCVAILDGLLNAFKRRQAAPSSSVDPLGALLASKSPEIRSRAAELAGRYKVEPLYPIVKNLVNDENEAVANGAVAGLEGYATDDAMNELKRLSSDKRLWTAATIGLLAHRPQEAAKEFVEHLKSGDELSSGEEGANKVTRLMQTILNRKDGPGLLTESLKDRAIDTDLAKAALRVVASSGRPEETLTAAIRAAGRLEDQPKKLSPEEMQSLLAEVKAHGDAAKGEAIFRREEMICLKCHAVGDAGGVVGPNLVSLGASSQPDYILESLVDPNAKVKENFNTIVVATDDGEVITGIKVRETGTDLILRDAEDRETSVPLSKIEQQKAGASIMPAGLLDKLTRAELVDLTAFLSSLGRVPEYSIGQKPIARRWEVLKATPEAQGLFYRLGLQTVTKDNAVFEWQRAYSRVKGELPVERLPDMKMLGQTKGDRGLTFIRCEVEAASAGEAKLSLDAPPETRAWIDEQAAQPGTDWTVNLPAGKHKITLAINQAEPTKPVTLSISDPGKAGLRFVGGK